MKVTLLAMLFIAASNLVIAQDSRNNAPPNVRQSFHRDFPAADNPRWSRSNGQWHANFDDRSSDDRGEMVAHYDQTGRYIDAHVPYAQQDVPTVVYERARRRYHRQHGLHFIRIEHPGLGDFFQVRVNVNGRTRTSYYDEQGREKEYSDHH